MSRLWGQRSGAADLAVRRTVHHRTARRGGSEVECHTPRARGAAARGPCDHARETRAGIADRARLIHCPHAARARRRADRRRRPVRHRRRATTCRSTARARRYAILEARDAHRRHLGPVPLPRASARTPTCTRWATRSGRGRRRRRSPTGPSILDYVRETAAEYGIDRHIRFHHRVERAAWSSRRRALDGGGASAPTPGEVVQLTCGFLFVVQPATTATTRATRRSSRAASGSRGGSFTRSTGPRTLDYAGKRVVVIGSGATAVTLVPAMAKTRGARDDAPALADATSSRCRPSDPIAERAAPRAAGEAGLRARALEERRL